MHAATAATRQRSKENERTRDELHGGSATCMRVASVIHRHGSARHGEQRATACQPPIPGGIPALRARGRRSLASTASLWPSDLDTITAAAGPARCCPRPSAGWSPSEPAGCLPAWRHATVTVLIRQCRQVLIAHRPLPLSTLPPPRPRSSAAHSAQQKKLLFPPALPPVFTAPQTIATRIACSRQFTCIHEQSASY